MSMMTQNPATSPAEFKTLFPDITVGFNWRRFEAEAWPVRRITLAERDEILQLHTFFRYSLGRINGHFLHWLAMRQMRVGEVLAKLGRVPQRDRASISHFAQVYAKSAAPIALAIPTFALPQGGQYIMDFNHRLCGLALSGAQFQLDLHSIQGPLSADVLKDAIHCRTSR